MSAHLASRILPLAGLLLATPAFAQEGWVTEPPRPPVQPAPAPNGCPTVVVTPDASSGCATVVVQPPPPPGAYGPAPQPLPGAYWPAPQPPGPYYYPVPPPLPSGAYAPAPGWGYEPEPRSRSVFSAKLWLGPAYQRLYDVPFYGADFGLSLGAQRGMSGWYGEMQGFVGRTDHGLPTYEYWVGPTWEGKIDRVHLGLGMHFGWTGIGRATQGDMMTGLGFGFFGFASVDLYQTEAGHALYVAARMTGNWVDGGNTTAAQYGPSASLGWRY